MAQTFSEHFDELPPELQIMVWRELINSDPTVFPCRLDSRRTGSMTFKLFFDSNKHYGEDTRIKQRQLKIIEKVAIGKGGRILIPAAQQAIDDAYKHDLWKMNFNSKGHKSQVVNNDTDLMVLENPMMEAWEKMNKSNPTNEEASKVRNLAMPFNFELDAWNHACICAENHPHDKDGKWCHAPIQGLLERFRGVRTFYFIIEMHPSILVKKNLLELTHLHMGRKESDKKLNGMGLGTAEKRQDWSEQLVAASRETVLAMHGLTRKAKQSHPPLKVFEHGRCNYVEVNRKHVTKYIRKADKLYSLIDALKNAPWGPIFHTDPSGVMEERPREIPEFRVLVTLSGAALGQWRKYQAEKGLETEHARRRREDIMERHRQELRLRQEIECEQRELRLRLWRERQERERQQRERQERERQESEFWDGDYHMNIADMF